MTRSRPVGVLVVVAVVAVLLGVLVLRSPGAHVDPYAAAVDRTWLDELGRWNRARAVGAVLVLAGLTAAALLTGLLLGTRAPHSSPRQLLVGALTAAVLVVGGLAAFDHLQQPVIEYVGIAKASDAPPLVRSTVYAPTGWSRGQTVAALTVAAGLLLASGTAGAAAGRRQGRAAAGPHVDRT